MNDLISRQEVIDAIRVYANRYKDHIGKPNDSEVYAYSRGLILSIEMSINALPSAEPWDVVKTMLKELEQKEERLCSDYCDAIARLKAIRKIVESSQTPKRMIDGIKPLAEMEARE